MADVPDDAIPRGIEDPVQRDGELDGAQRRAEVSAVAGDDVDELLADLGGERGRAERAASVLRSAGEEMRSSNGVGLRSEVAA